MVSLTPNVSTQKAHRTANAAVQLATRGKNGVCRLFEIVGGFVFPDISIAGQFTVRGHEQDDIYVDALTRHA